MYVKTKMTANPYTISHDAPINDVIELMREKNLKRVPVLDGEKLVGIVTNGDLQKVSPTKATTLSIYEINYLLSKMRVSDAMTKEVVTISQDALLEEAAVMMRENKVSTLAVVKNGKLTGIITESDIFDAFIDLLGFRDAGSRITLQAADIPGALAAIGEIYRSFDANISHIAVYRAGTGVSNVVIRSNALNTEKIESALEEQGYKIESVMRNEL